MHFDRHSEEPPSFSQSVFQWFRGLGQGLAFRFLLVVGVAIFLTVVGFDSLRQASAADMTVDRTNALPAMTVVSQAAPAVDQSADAATEPSQASYLTFDAETANRLKRSDFTRASLTRSRLTSSHLFTHMAQ